MLLSTINVVMHLKSKRTVSFTWATAKEMTDSFACTSGVHTRLCDREGNLIYQQGAFSEGCTFCHRFHAISGEPLPCRQVHLHGALEAARFGGRYIYFCSSGMAYFSSPIVTGGAVSGAFVSGPVLIIDQDEVLSDAQSGTVLSAQQRSELQQALDDLPQMAPAQLSQMAKQLFASAVYVSDSTHELFLRQQGDRQQNTIGAYIQQFKSDKLAKLYPTETEHDLVDAISNGNFDSAEAYLNEILGYLFYSAAETDTLHSRIAEVLTVMGRGALYSGADSEQVFAICHRGATLLRRVKSNEEMARLLTDSLQQLVALVYLLAESSHKNTLLRTIDYMRRNCSQHLTLRQAADFAGYSPTYFSRLFKQEVGQSFQHFLNQLRVDKSKALLLSTTESSAAISGMVGFEDQSYFCKVFKQFAGVTPDQYRKRRRRIDETRERDKARKKS